MILLSSENMDGMYVCHTSDIAHKTKEELMAIIVRRGCTRYELARWRDQRDLIRNRYLDTLKLDSDVFHPEF